MAASSGSARRERLAPSPARSWCSCAPESGRAEHQSPRRIRSLGATAELASRGFLNERGNAFSAASISSMLA